MKICTFYIQGDGGKHQHLKKRHGKYLKRPNKHLEVNNIYEMKYTVDETNIRIDSEKEDSAKFN